MTVGDDDQLLAGGDQRLPELARVVEAYVGQEHVRAVLDEGVVERARPSVPVVEVDPQLGFPASTGRTRRP